MKGFAGILATAGLILAMGLMSAEETRAGNCDRHFNEITGWFEQTPDNRGKCHMENVPDDSEYPDHSIPYKLRNGRELCPRHRYQMDWEFLWKNGKRVSGIYYLGSESRMTLSFKESFIPDGPVRIFRGEKLVCEAPVNNKGKADGIVKEYSPEGKLIHAFRMTGGKRNGGFVKYDKQGKLDSFACEDKPVFDGDAERCGFRGRSAVVKLPEGRTLTHLKGKLISEEIVGRDGKRTIKEFSYSGTGLEVEKVAEYYKNGKLHQSFFRKGGKLDGEFREFYDDGTPSEKGVAETGRIVKLSQYFRNGTLKLEARLGKNGELCEARIFNSDGKPDVEGVFKAKRGSVAWEVPHGKVRNYDHEGSLDEEGEYANGKRVGCHTFYLKEGKKEEIDYVEGAAKKLRQFDAKGKLVKEFEVFKDGSRREISKN
jgi:antitoxin component YwqK of YwqJK toxin-antitoxin module